MRHFAGCHLGAIMGLYASKGEDGDKEKQFDDDYTLCQRIGKGAFAEVYMCVHKESKERRAAKIVDVQKLDAKDKAHLEDEIEILKRLHHPGIIRLFDVYRSSTSVYIVQELCSGGELFDRIVLRHHYTEHCARELVRHVLSAVSYAHSQGVVHRDLKPENILLADKDDDTHVKLADFGLAHALGGIDGLHTICGTPSYMSPEVVSRKPYTEKTDCWSVGVITYVLLGGFCPFEDPSLPVMLSRIKKAQYKFWNPYFRQVSDDAKDFIKHLLVVDPAKRLTARAALEHKWFRVSKRSLSVHCLVMTQEKLKEMRTARTKFKAAVDTVIGLNRMRMLSGGSRLSDSMSSGTSMQSPRSSVGSLDSSLHSPDSSRHGPSSSSTNRLLSSPSNGSSSAAGGCSSPDTSQHNGVVPGAVAMNGCFRPASAPLPEPTSKPTGEEQGPPKASSVGRMESYGFYEINEDGSEHHENLQQQPPPPPPESGVLPPPVAPVPEQSVEALLRSPSKLLPSPVVEEEEDEDADDDNNNHQQQKQQQAEGARPNGSMGSSSSNSSSSASSSGYKSSSSSSSLSSATSGGDLKGRYGSSEQLLNRVAEEEAPAAANETQE